MINPSDICEVINTYKNNPNTIVNAMCKIESEDDFRSFTVPKVVVSKSNKLLYMSRSAIPLSKVNQFHFAYKQVCIYAFSKFHLEFFATYKAKTEIEEVEDIEILRFLENDITVQMIEVDSSSFAIDIPEDIPRVIDKLNCTVK